MIRVRRVVQALTLTMLATLLDGCRPSSSSPMDPGLRRGDDRVSESGAPSGSGSGSVSGSGSGSGSVSVSVSGSGSGSVSVSGSGSGSVSGSVSGSGSGSGSVSVSGSGSGSGSGSTVVDPSPLLPSPRRRPGSIGDPAASSAPRASAPHPSAPRIELTFTGDINVGGYYADHYDPQPVEVHDPLLAMDAALASDLAVANLETTIARTLPNHGMAHAGTGEKRFVTIPERIAFLPRHGIRTVTLANNHQFDNGPAGLTDTPAILAELGITALGAARADEPLFRVETVDVAGWRVGFIAATTQINRRPPAGSRPAIAFVESAALASTLAPVIASARTDHDLVLVTVHWGIQYSDTPEPWQITAAHALIDAGADAVIGHHPHVLQGIERYRAGVIAYSLGNFVFPNAKDPVRQTGVLRLGFARPPRPPGPPGVPGAAPACLALAAFQPAIQVRSPLTHPVPATADLFALVRDRIVGLSGARPLATAWLVEDSRLVTTATCP